MPSGDGYCLDPPPRMDGPGAPGGTYDVVGEDIHASLAQATSPVSGAGADFDEGPVPGETVERVIAWDSESVLAAEMVSDLQPVVLVVSPARDHPILGTVATQLGATDPATNARAIRSGPFLEVRIPRHGQDAREWEPATTLESPGQAGLPGLRPPCPRQFGATPAVRSRSSSSRHSAA